MNFIQEYISETEMSDSDEITISKGTTEVTLRDGSKHLLPNVNICAMEILKKRKIRKANLENERNNRRYGYNAATREENILPMSSTTNTVTNNQRYAEINEPEVILQIDGTNAEEETNNQHGNHSSPLLNDNMTWLDLAGSLNDHDKFLTLLKNEKLIASSNSCSKCSNEMKWSINNNTSDGYVWRCNKCKSTKSIRTGSFFKMTKTKMTKSYSIIYFWSVGIPGNMTKRMMMDVPVNTIYDFYNFSRDICCQILTKDPVIFHSNNEIAIELQIDESLFGKSRKYHKGKHFKQQWVFGISDPASHNCWMEVVKDRTAETLCNIIERHIPKTNNLKIISDGWASYSKLTEMGYKHSVVIHSEEFVNSEGEHTNSVESVWSQAKCWIRSMHGVRRELLPNYLMEFVYRYNYCGSGRGMCWSRIKEDIAKLYKVDE